jgi:trimeric autotransporter adhesin
MWQLSFSLDADLSRQAQRHHRRRFHKQEYNDFAAESARSIWFHRQRLRGQNAAGGLGQRIGSCGFLIGIPDTSAIAYGNADKYFRETGVLAYFTDDWRVCRS